MQRMELCKQSSRFFGYTFKLEINGQMVL